MSLEKAIKHGKEKRKPYYKSGKFDTNCRPHGSCSYCLENRCHKHKRNFKEIDMEEVYDDIRSDAL